MVQPGLRPAHPRGRPLHRPVGLGSGGEGGLDLDHDADLGHDFDAAHAHPEADAHLLGAVLGLLGVGKVPLSILLMSLFLVWGGAGLVFKAVFGPGAMHQVIALAALCAVVGARLVAEGLAALLPGEESYHTPPKALLGQTGQVLYEVTRDAGAVRLRDLSGNLRDLDCRSQDEEPIAPGTRVVLCGYDPAGDVFLVRAESGPEETEEQREAL